MLGPCTPRPPPVRVSSLDPSALSAKPSLARTPLPRPQRSNRTAQTPTAGSSPRQTRRRHHRSALTKRVLLGKSRHVRCNVSRVYWLDELVRGSLVSQTPFLLWGVLVCRAFQIRYLASPCSAVQTDAVAGLGHRLSRSSKMFLAGKCVLGRIYIAPRGGRWRGREGGRKMGGSCGKTGKISSSARCSSKRRCGEPAPPNEHPGCEHPEMRRWRFTVVRGACPLLNGNLVCELAHSRTRRLPPPPSAPASPPPLPARARTRNHPSQSLKIIPPLAPNPYMALPRKS